MKKFEHGLPAVDKLTGFSGIITGHADYITGCDKYLLQPKLGAGEKEYPEGVWIDEGRLEITGEKQIDLEELKGEDPGACGEAPRK